MTLEEKGELKAASSIDIRCELEGRSTIIQLVPEGTHVKKGDLLVELASDEIDDKIRDAEIKSATAQAAFEASEKERQILIDENASKVRKAQLALWLAEHAVEKYQEGESAELKQDADLALQKARYVLQRAQEQFKDSKELYDQGYVTRIEMENDKFAEYQAGIELKKAELALEVLSKYTIPMALQEKNSDVEEAKKELERTKKAAMASEAKAASDVSAKESELKLVQEKLTKLRDQKTKARIVAPAEGLVVYARENSWHREDTIIETGKQVFERQSLIELPDTSSMKVVIRVHEAKTGMLKLGLPATVTVEGVSGNFRRAGFQDRVLADSHNAAQSELKESKTNASRRQGEPAQAGRDGALQCSSRRSRTCWPCRCRLSSARAAAISCSPKRTATCSRPR